MNKIFFKAATAIWLCLAGIAPYTVYAQNLRIAFFNVDATPKIGMPVAYAITRHIDDSLSARGVILIPKNEKPVVLCAVDWIGISNDGQDAWKNKLAAAAKTTPDRVSVHALHQHDGARCDFSIEKIMSDYGMGNQRLSNAFVSTVISATANAVSNALKNTIPVTAIGFGKAKVDSVASNRRVVGKDGAIIPRWSAVRDSFLQNAPEGLIDPWLKCVSFWNGDKPVALLTYYATHPQSYYGKGDVTCEFVGIARNNFEGGQGIPVVHFTGAAGNISAGKYNDGSAERRKVLAGRIEKGMREAWKNTETLPLAEGDIGWNTAKISLPLGNNINKAKLLKILDDRTLTVDQRFLAAEKLAWYNRSKMGTQVTISALRLGKNWLLNLPGEAFVEYQLYAQRMRPDGNVCTAAYEEYGPGYICTSVAYYEKGGYETSAIVSGTAPEVEPLMLKAINEVLK